MEYREKFRGWKYAKYMLMFYERELKHANKLYVYKKGCNYPLFNQLNEKYKQIIRK